MISHFRTSTELELPLSTTVGSNLAEDELSGHFVVLGVVVVSGVVLSSRLGLAGAALGIGLVAVVLDTSGPTLGACGAGSWTRMCAVAGAGTLVIRLVGSAGLLAVGDESND